MIRLDKLTNITPTEYSKYRYICEMLEFVRKDLINVCDVGCGSGNILSLLEGYPIKIKGIDYSEASIEAARAKVSRSDIVVEKKDVFELDEQFDLVLLSEVLEHIKEDRKLLDFLYSKIVKRGGYLILSVPAHRLLYSKFDRAVGHFRRYDRGALMSMLEESGFVPLIFWSYGSAIFHMIANLAGCQKIGYEKADMESRTKDSGIREFSPFLTIFVSRVNMIHRFFFFLDRIFRHFDFGIEYCILCRTT